MIYLFLFYARTCAHMDLGILMHGPLLLVAATLVCLLYSPPLPRTALAQRLLAKFGLSAVDRTWMAEGIGL